MNITDDYDNFTKYSNNENYDIYLFVKHLFPSIPSSIILLYLVTVIVWTILEHFFFTTFK